MTLSELAAIDKVFLTPAQIAPVLETDPNLIRWQAHHEPEKLGFRVIVIRSRVKIVKESFLEYMGFKGERYNEQV